jgi:hypothetical protein
MLAFALLRFSPKRCKDIAIRLVDELGMYEQIEMARKQLQEDLEHAYDRDDDDTGEEYEF